MFIEALFKIANTQNIHNTAGHESERGTTGDMEENVEKGMGGWGI
jgi:hypothetical protein